MDFLQRWGPAKSDPVTQKIARYEFPTRVEQTEQTGYSEAFLPKTFSFMYASSFGMVNKEGMHKPVHFNDVASTTAYRHDESGFVLKPKGMAVAYLHDLLEELAAVLAGKRKPTYSLPAAYVVADVAHHLLAEDTGVDMRKVLLLLTNRGDIIFDTVKNYFQSKAQPGELIVNTQDLVARLDKTYDGFSIDQEAIKSLYGKLIQRWQHVQRLLTRPKHTYLTPDERGYIRDTTIGGFISQTQNRLDKGGVLTTSDIEREVNYEYKRVRALIEQDKLPEIPPVLVMPQNSPTIMSVEQAIYTMLYLQDMVDEVIRYSAALDEDPLVLKNIDARDNSGRLGPNMNNVISQFMKYTGLLEKDAEVIREQRRRGSPYQILELAKDFLYETLRGAIKRKRASLEGDAKAQTQYKPHVPRLVYMDESIRALDDRIRTRPTVKEHISRLAQRAHLI